MVSEQSPTRQETDPDLTYGPSFSDVSNPGFQKGIVLLMLWWVYIAYGYRFIPNPKPQSKAQIFLKVLKPEGSKNFGSLKLPKYVRCLVYPCI